MHPGSGVTQRCVHQLRDIRRAEPGRERALVDRQRNPPDTSMTLISRTVGTDSLVDEMLFSFTHTSEIDWMLPSIAPTGRKVEIPLVAIVL
jgi:hypothetical protein